MQIGFLMDKYDPELVSFAGDAGFDSIELFTIPESGINLEVIGDAGIKRVAEHFESNSVKIGAICVSLNHLDDETTKRKANNEYFKLAIKNCKKFGTDLITTNTWGNIALTPAENISLYKEVFTEYAKIAEAEGVVIAMENCPHSVGYPIAMGNIGYSPEMWEALFDAVPSKAIGLELDPSHLFWQQIDIERAIRAFGERIYAFHAKDTEIMKDGMYRYGIYGKMFGKNSEWDYGCWRYRIPGWGDINWKGAFRALNDAAYKGPVFIEHEDPVMTGDRHREGLELGLRFLRGFTL